jgi:hypothetical protein
MIDLNKVVVNHFIVWEYRFKVKVECDMSKIETIGNQISNGHINNTQYSKPAVGSGHFAIQMRFFNDSKYQFHSIYQCVGIDNNIIRKL